MKGGIYFVECCSVTLQHCYLWSVAVLRYSIVTCGVLQCYVTALLLVECCSVTLQHCYLWSVVVLRYSTVTCGVLRDEHSVSLRDLDVGRVPSLPRRVAVSVLRRSTLHCVLHFVDKLSASPADFDRSFVLCVALLKCDNAGNET
jgi:hypothetical protein